MAECPSPAYLDYVVTSSGLTPRDPFGAIATNWDYSEWVLTAERMIYRMERAREYLGQKEPSPFTEWERLRERANDVRKRFSELSEPWGIGAVDLKAEITRAVDIAIEAACLWEEHDIAIEALGEVPPAKPAEVPGGKGPKQTWQEQLVNTTLTLGVLFALGWAGVTIYKARLAKGGFRG